jgi:uncharacterized protein
LRVLIAGISTRAAAESAARAGCDVTAIDAFADLDQHPAVHAVSLGQAFSARTAALASRDTECDAVVYLSNFENHPRAIGLLASGRALWGNSPQSVTRARDPFLLADALHSRGLAAPQTRGDNDPPRAGAWLVKPRASGGGRRISRWQQNTTIGRRAYLQEFIEGTSGSVVFVAAERRALTLGVSRQLVGDRSFGADGFEYCGSILESAPLDTATRERFDAFVGRARALADAVADAFDLVGLNGVDFVTRGGVPYAVELNPRWCASMELVERAYDLSLFAIHQTACTTRTLPAFDLRKEFRQSNTIGKAVVYARRDLTIGNTAEWLADSEIRDVPHPGQPVPKGGPVCTIFATGEDAEDCHEALLVRARHVYERLDAWS